MMLRKYLLESMTQYELAHRTAQRNAALPIEQGGLGLHPNNTAQERANAMGYTTKAYHGTGSEIKEFIKQKAHDKEGRSMGLGLGKGKFYFATDLDIANNYALSSPYRMNYSKTNGKKYGSGIEPNVLPVLLKVNKSYNYDSYLDKIYDTDNNVRDKKIAKLDKELIKNKFDSITGHDNIAVFHPHQIRSIHAAFDPMRKHESDLLA